MSLAENQRRHLRQLGHHLKPVIIVGQAGLTDAVMTETDAALSHHELLKIRVNAADRESRRTIIGRLVTELGAERVHAIGHIALVYRQNPDKPRIVLPRPLKKQR